MGTCRQRFTKAWKAPPTLSRKPSISSPPRWSTNFLLWPGRTSSVRAMGTLTWRRAPSPSRTRASTGASEFDYKTLEGRPRPEPRPREARHATFGAVGPGCASRRSGCHHGGTASCAGRGADLEPDHAGPARDDDAPGAADARAAGRHRRAYLRL